MTKKKWVALYANVALATVMTLNLLSRKPGGELNTLAIALAFVVPTLLGSGAILLISAGWDALTKGVMFINRREAKGVIARVGGLIYIGLGILLLTALAQSLHESF